MKKMDMWVPLKKKRDTKREIWRGTNRRALGERGEDFLNFFSLFPSFSDLWKYDCRISSG